MTTWPAISGSGIEAAGRHFAQGSAASVGDGRAQSAGVHDRALPERGGTASPGVQATFSPESLQALEHSALDLAGTARQLVQGIGQTANDLVETAAVGIDNVGAQAASLVTAGADALVEGIGAVRSGVNGVANAAAEAVTVATGRMGDAVESTVGYAALAGLAGGALLNVLV